MLFSIDSENEDVKPGKISFSGGFGLG